MPTRHGVSKRSRKPVFPKRESLLGVLNKPQFYNLLILLASVFALRATPRQVGGFEQMATLRQAKMFRADKLHRISSLSVNFL